MNPFRLLAEPHPGGWELFVDNALDGATLELLMRHYMNEDERRVSEGLNPCRQRNWLLGRIAAKDAARRHLTARRAVDAEQIPPAGIFPAEISVLNDDLGAPFLKSSIEGTAGLRVSIAHTDRMAVAMVADGVTVGIDIERIGTRSERFEQFILTDSERALVPASGADRDAALTRLWCVKEAAAKAAGTGLEGKPKQFVVKALAEVHYEVAGRPIDTEVVKTEEGEFVVAWTVC